MMNCHVFCIVSFKCSQEKGSLKYGQYWDLYEVVGYSSLVFVS